jgi:hypothetical protein
MKKHSFSLCISLCIATAILIGSHSASAQTPDGKGQVCRMEQQCHWENFKKHCVWVKVCR